MSFYEAQQQAPVHCVLLIWITIILCACACACVILRLKYMHLIIVWVSFCFVQCISFHFVSLTKQKEGRFLAVWSSVSRHSHWVSLNACMCVCVWLRGELAIVQNTMSNKTIYVPLMATWHCLPIVDCSSAFSSISFILCVIYVSLSPSFFQVNEEKDKSTRFKLLVNEGIWLFNVSFLIIFFLSFGRSDKILPKIIIDTQLYYGYGKRRQ